MVLEVKNSIVKTKDDFSENNQPFILLPTQANIDNFWLIYDVHSRATNIENVRRKEIADAWNTYSPELRQKLIQERYRSYLKNNLKKMLCNEQLYAHLEYRKFLMANDIYEKEDYYLKVMTKIKNHRLFIFIMTHALSFGANLAKAIETYHDALSKLPILGLISAVFSLTWRIFFSVPVELGTSYDEYIYTDEYIALLRLTLSLVNTGVSVAYLLTMGMIGVITGTGAVAIGFVSAYAYIPAVIISIGIELFQAHKCRERYKIANRTKANLEQELENESNIVAKNELQLRITALENYIARTDAEYKCHTASAKIWSYSLGAMTIVSVATTIVTLTIAGAVSTLSCGIIPAIIGLAILAYTLYKISQKKRELNETLINKPKVLMSTNKNAFFNQKGLELVNSYDQDAANETQNKNDAIRLTYQLEKLTGMTERTSACAYQ